MTDTLEKNRCSLETLWRSTGNVGPSPGDGNRNNRCDLIGRFGKKFRAGVFPRQGAAMERFETLFGVKKSEVRETCVIIPFFRRDLLDGFGVTALSRGKLYGSASNGSLTLIHTRVGPTFLGDAVLHLAETACRRVMLFGTCGLVDSSTGYGIGSVVCPSECYAAESFTSLLRNKEQNWEKFYPDRNLYDSFLEKYSHLGVRGVTCLTIGSLKLQEERIRLLKEKGIDIVDMECSSLFSACAFTGRRAMALLCTADIIHEKPFYSAPASEDHTALSTSLNKAVRMLCKFITEKSTA
jgi:nucleoside phosphorylase